jgi:hypothetical protein
MKWIAMSILATAATLPAQTASAFEERYFTQGQPNCRWFNSLANVERSTYIFGIWDAMPLLAASNWNPYSVNTTNGETAEGIGAICLVPENAGIRAIDAYMIFAAKVHGASAAFISETTAEARQYAIYGPTKLTAPTPTKKEQ